MYTDSAKYTKIYYPMTKRLPKEERRNIYQLAADRIECGSDVYCCDAINSLMAYRHGKIIGSPNIPDWFEELQMFEPENIEINHTGIGWWKDGDKKTRITALLLCAELCR
jgi:hypothetical protein